MRRVVQYMAGIVIFAAVPPIRAQQLRPHPQDATTHRVAIAAHDLPRGTVLSASDIAWTTDSSVTSSIQTIPSRAARATHRATATQNTQPEQPHTVVPGWITRRSIRAGEPLVEPGVSRPDLVSTGDLVDVVYRDDGIRIKVRGTAVGSGAQGDAIYVKLDNRRRVRGIVDGANIVRIL